MTKGLLGEMKTLSMAVALNDSGSELKARNDGLIGEKQVLEATVAKLENDFADYKDKHEIQAGLITNCANQDKEIEAVKKKLEEVEYVRKPANEVACKIVALEVENKDLESALKTTIKQVEAQGDNKLEDLAGLDHVGLIAKIQEVQQDFIVGTPYGFNNVAAQMKALNLGVELNTKGVHFLKETKDGLLVAPDGFDEEDDE